MSKHVLITGVGGSIGVHVLMHIIRNTEWEITGIDSFRHKGLAERLPDWVIRLPRVRVFTHDLTAPISGILTQKIGKVDYVIHLASISDVDLSIDDPTVAIHSNVQIETTILEYARAVSPSVFLQISTDEVYGPTDGRSAHMEWDPIVPSNPYSASKACQEAIAIAYWRSYSVPLIIVNLMNNFGEMQSGGKFPCIVQRYVRQGRKLTLHKFGDAYGSRFYMHSRNSADAMIFLLQRTTPFMHVPGEVDRPDRYNIVGDEQVNNYELAQLIADTLGKPLQFDDLEIGGQRPGHDGHYGLNGTKIAALGWKSPLTFRESMKNTIGWYEENPEWLDPK
jgi:dTDP-glucose 4,6-dehydratase